MTSYDVFEFLEFVVRQGDHAQPLQRNIFGWDKASKNCLSDRPIVNSKTTLDRRKDVGQSIAIFILEWADAVESDKTFQWVLNYQKRAT